jgi:hypothetical protein
VVNSLDETPTYCHVAIQLGFRKRSCKAMCQLGPQIVYENGLEARSSRGFRSIVEEKRLWKGHQPSGG